VAEQVSRRQPAGLAAYKPANSHPEKEPRVFDFVGMLAKQIDATVVPMSMVALRCQTVRPDLTLRYVNDGHLNQTMGYLTACTFYAALFNRSPEGLTIDTVNDKMRSRDGKPAQDPDGGPLKRTFSAQDRADLQRIAWEGLQQFQQLAASAGVR
jgi:hypothetical protein